MAKRILGWDVTRSYKTSTGSFRRSFSFWQKHPNSILIPERHDLRFHSIVRDTIKNRDIILREIAGGRMRMAQTDNGCASSPHYGEGAAPQGRLKIFFGYAAGVG